MENLEDKDKTIAILRSRLNREKKNNEVLKDEIALLEYEFEKLKAKSNQ